MKIPIIGYGLTKFKEHWDLNLSDLAIEAANKAISSAKINVEEIDAIYLANNFNMLNNLGDIATHISKKLNVKKVCNISGADVAGAAAIRQAAMSIMSEENKVVLVIGAEKMSDFVTPDLLEMNMLFLDKQDYNQGITPTALFALLTKIHMKKYGTTKDALAQIPEDNHKNASLNKNAQYPFPVSKESILNSPIVSDPITTLSCTSNPDGAAALIMTREDLSKKYTDSPIYLIGTGQAHDSLSIRDRNSLTELKATIDASKIAYSDSNLSPKDIDVAEVHDVFPISELLALEDLGFIEKGSFKGFESNPNSSSNSTASGLLPKINPSGGLKGCGHPLAATGVRQACEIVAQLKGECEKENRQVKDAKIGLTHTMGGIGASCIVNIFSK